MIMTASMRRAARREYFLLTSCEAMAIPAAYNID
jgi:nitrogenase subunit NifH